MSRKPDPIPSLLERAHPRDPSRRLAFVSYTTPDGQRRQKIMGDAGTPKAERSYREFLKAYLAGSPPRTSQKGDGDTSQNLDGFFWTSRNLGTWTQKRVTRLPTRNTPNDTHNDVVRDVYSMAANTAPCPVRAKQVE